MSRSVRSPRPLFLGLLLVIGCPGLGHAENSADFQVSAQIESGCLVNSAVPANGADVGALGTLDFGLHSALSTATVQASLVRNAGIIVSCTPGTTVVMRIDGGQNFNGNRRLRLDSQELLDYRIYRQSGCVGEIPVDSDVALDISGSTEDIAIPIHGCVALPGNAAAGIYQDTLIVTLAW